jgi:hypothetical protein
MVKKIFPLHKIGFTHGHLKLESFLLSGKHTENIDDLSDHASDVLLSSFGIVKAMYDDVDKRKL